MPISSQAPRMEKVQRLAEPARLNDRISARHLEQVMI